MPNPGGKTVIAPAPGGGAGQGGAQPLPTPGAPRKPQGPAPNGPAPNSTVIQPAFHPQPAPAQRPAPQSPFSDPSSPFGAPSKPSPRPASPFNPPPQYGVPQHAQDDWMSGRPHMRPPSHIVPDARPAQAPSVAQRIPLDVALNARDGIDFDAANPITAAAAPLLILLGRLRLQIVEMQAVPLMQHVGRSITEFERKVLEAGVPPEDVTVAKYALCATADDIVQNLPGTDRHVWMQYSMLAQFFQVRTSGIGFFEELQKVMANPAPRYNLLELMHACLSLGFEGQYRGVSGGDTELQRIRRDVYQTLRHIKARNDEDISPRWRGLALAMKDLSSRVPVWAVASIAGVVLVGTFFLLRFLLSGDANLVAERLVKLHPSAGITIGRASFEPFTEELFDPRTGQLERIRAELAPEIEAGGMNVEPIGDQIVVRLDNLILFDSGKAEVKQAFIPVAERIAAALDNEPGPINVIGHTDSIKPSPGARYKSNYDLSVARAESVQKALAPHISDPARIVVTGKGEDEPIADNATAEGRAQNRRVEIMIPKEETLAARGG
ncbi:MAG: type VI secretion system protein TssL, long form [Rhizobiaceae bacterium]|nr:type VI secretion system protein TssL, long form [Rhizobiaceae bacterium]MCV0405796.1 type VI secretion system protein TssL, long form [Rhizobiaceae bacterium]